MYRLPSPRSSLAYTPRGDTSVTAGRRCLDNVWIERFWRTIKREYVYINPTDNVKELREGIKNYIEYYNTKRPHQGIEHQIPMTKYAKIAA